MAKVKAKRPTRDEFELEELGERLVEAKAEESTVRLSIWGIDDPVQGTVEQLDSRTKLVHVMQGNGEVRKVPFLDIMKVGSPF